jgi:hypothetical protein
MMPNKKLNALAAATRIGVAAQRLAAIEREAALKMPIKDALRDTGIALREKLDANLAEAIERYFGRPFVPEEVVDRLTLHPDGEEVPQEERGAWYAMDGKPILWAGPVKVERKDDEMHAHQALKHHTGSRESTP